MSKKDILQSIFEINRAIFTTKEIASLRNASISTTSQSLSILANKGIISKIRKNLWCISSNKSFSEFSIPMYLEPTHQVYISFLSALHLYGMIEQIPQTVFVATTAHSKKVKTGFGTFSFHQIIPEFFFGFDWYNEDNTFLIASKEKALVAIDELRKKYAGYYDCLVLNEYIVNPKNPKL